MLHLSGTPSSTSLMMITSLAWCHLQDSSGQRKLSLRPAGKAITIIASTCSLTVKDDVADCIIYTTRPTSPSAASDAEPGHAQQQHSTSQPLIKPGAVKQLAQLLKSFLPSGITSVIIRPELPEQSSTTSTAAMGHSSRGTASSTSSAAVQQDVAASLVSSNDQDAMSAVTEELLEMLSPHMHTITSLTCTIPLPSSIKGQLRTLLPGLKHLAVASASEAAAEQASWLHSLHMGLQSLSIKAEPAAGSSAARDQRSAVDLSLLADQAVSAVSAGGAGGSAGSLPATLQELDVEADEIHAADAALRRMTQLRSLRLVSRGMVDGPGVLSRGLGALMGLSQLRMLEVPGQEVDAQGLAVLAGMPAMEKLVIGSAVVE